MNETTNQMSKLPKVHTVMHGEHETEMLETAKSDFLSKGTF